MNRLFEDQFQSVWDENRNDKDFSPLVDVNQDNECYEISVELPSVKQTDVAVEVKDNILSITGTKNQSRKSDMNEQVQTHRRYGRFQQTLSLPDDVEEGNISASFDNGLLTVTIPRDSERRREITRQIEVTSSNNAGKLHSQSRDDDNQPESHLKLDREKKRWHHRSHHEH